jgi:hypothetical protein
MNFGSEWQSVTLHNLPESEYRDVLKKKNL